MPMTCTSLAHRLGLGSRTSNCPWPNICLSCSISNSSTLGLRVMASRLRSSSLPLLLVERWLCGDELRVRGDVMVDVVRMELGDAERREARLGLKAVRRRRSEPLVLRRGVKDWKRLVRLEEGIVVVVLVVLWICCSQAITVL